MNSDRLTTLIQKGFRVTVGATSSLIEILQDPQKREESLEKLKSADFNVLAEEWEQKGELTEREARNFVETILSQQNQQTSTDAGNSPEPPTATPPDSNPVPKVETEIQELTAQLAALRIELENLRASDSD